MAEPTIPTPNQIIKDFEYQLDRLKNAADELDTVIYRIGQIYSALTREYNKE